MRGPGGGGGGAAAATLAAAAALNGLFGVWFEAFVVDMLRLSLLLALYAALASGCVYVLACCPQLYGGGGM